MEKQKRKILYRRTRGVLKTTNISFYVYFIWSCLSTWIRGDVSVRFFKLLFVSLDFYELHETTSLLWSNGCILKHHRTNLQWHWTSMLRLQDIHGLDIFQRNLCYQESGLTDLQKFFHPLLARIVRSRARPNIASKSAFLLGLFFWQACCTWSWSLQSKHHFLMPAIKCVTPLLRVTRLKKSGIRDVEPFGKISAKKPAASSIQPFLGLERLL